MFEYGACSEVGQVRELNEDRFLATIVEGRFIGAVADGMGGHQGGEVASGIAVEEVEKAASALNGGASVREVFQALFTRANARILEAAAQSPALTGMGTTLTAACVESGRVWLGHVGDSRAYLLRRGQIAQLTDDDSLVEELVRQGQISPQEALSHPRRNVLLRALGTGSEATYQVEEETVEAGDVLLLCSDGLTTHVSDADIPPAVEAAATLQEAAERLVGLANERGGSDNVTVVLVRCPGDPTRRPLRGERRRGWRDWRTGLTVLGTLVFFALVVALLVGAGRNQLERSYFLWVHEGRVALIRGWPREIGGYPLYRLEQTTEVPVSRVKPLYRAELQKGLPLKDPAEMQERMRKITQETDAEHGTKTGPL